MLRKLLAAACLVIVVCVLGCSTLSSSEPPFSLGDGKPGQLVRETKLIRFDPSNRQIVYEVFYPAYGLTSVATLGLLSKEAISEVFAGRWTVLYRYDDQINQALQLPNTIEIYRYVTSGNNCGAPINTYTLTSTMASGVANYVDRRGRVRKISTTYLSIMSGGS